MSTWSYTKCVLTQFQYDVLDKYTWTAHLYTIKSYDKIVLYVKQENTASKLCDEESHK